MSSNIRRLPASIALVALVALASPALQAQQTAKLGAVITAFLADSGVPTRGLPWTTGSGLPVRWQTAKPVPVPHMRHEGFGLRREGKTRIAVDGQPPVDAVVELLGNDAGIQRASVMFDVDKFNLEAAERALAADGIRLAPLKCSRKTEGASYGNLVYVAKAPGKTASGLWESWNCAHDGCLGGFSILYRRAMSTRSSARLGASRAAAASPIGRKRAPFDVEREGGKKELIRATAGGVRTAVLM